jgi:hypothetical protein
MPILRLPEGELRDEIRLPLYDQVTIAAAESPVGIRQFYSAVQGKNRSQTNLRQNNLLETAVSYRVQGMAVDAQNRSPLNIDALAIIMENSSVRVRIGEKDYWEGPMTYLSGRLSHFSSGSTDVVYQRFGDLAIQPVMLEGKHVVDINPLQSFFAEWTCHQLSVADTAAATPDAGTYLKFYFSFKGLLRRPVQ